MSAAAIKMRLSLNLCGDTTDYIKVKEGIIKCLFPEENLS